MTLRVEFGSAPPGERRRPVMRIAIVAAVVAVAAVALGIHVLVRPGATPRTTSRADAVAVGLARQFLSDWVDPDGQVVRRDQGGDTVSEGQGYGMLLAVAADEPSEFDAIWTWTSGHLQRPDGSLAWRWAGGRVVDDEPASDADLDVTRALQLGATTWRSNPRSSTWTAAARRIAAATLARSTIRTDPGRILVGGPWATGSVGHPAQVAPSYIVAGEAQQLAQSTGATGWDAVASGTAVLDHQMVDSGRLSPDWASLTTGDRGAAEVSAVAPAPAPDHSEGIAYGLDAPRLLIRLAASCDRSDRSLAAGAPQASTLLGAAGVRSLDGDALVNWTHPVTDIAAAAVRSAQGDANARDHALGAAAAQEHATPTYYGAAWMALGQTLLTTRLLDSCARGTT